MAKVRFFESNSLKFKRLEDYTSLQNDNTRLYYDQLHPGIVKENYSQKHLNTDPLWLQFRTDYDITTVTLTLIKYDGTEVDLTSSIVLIATLETGLKQYEIVYDTTSLSGEYYLLFEFEQALYPLATYQSEWFEVDTEFPYHLKIEWLGESETYPDGLIWSTVTQKIWIYGRLFSSYFGAKSTVYEDSSYSLTTLKSQPIKFKKWEIEKIPDWIVEKINIALSHSTFKINGIQYASEERLPESEPIENGLSLYSYEMKLRQVDYEDYSTDTELTGTAPVFADDDLIFDNEDTLMDIDGTDTIKINN